MWIVKALRVVDNCTQRGVAHVVVRQRDGILAGTLAKTAFGMQGVKALVRNVLPLASTRADGKWHVGIVLCCADQRKPVQQTQCHASHDAGCNDLHERLAKIGTGRL